MEGKFEKLENPFSWKLDELDFNDILVKIQHKTEELCQDDWRVYVNRLLFCVIYEIFSDYNKCFDELNICKALVDKKKTSYDIVKKYNEAFTLITKITECYLLYKTNRQEEAEMLFEDITTEELDDKNKSAVYAIKTNFLMEFGIEGTEQAIYWSREARNLNFKEPEWHFLIGKTLFRSRHFITPVPEPEQEEVTAFENACEFSKTDDKNVSLAAVHYMCMLGICYKDKSKAIFHSDKSKLYTVEVDALNQKSSELMYKSRKLNDWRCHHLGLRISRTLLSLPFPYGDRDLAARDLKILLEKVPTNAYFNHSVAMLHIQQKQWRDAYKYLQLASDLKCFGASMTLLSMFKKWRNESFNIVEHFALFLKMYTNPIQQKQINSYVGIYYLLFTDDLITSLHYLEKAFDLDKGVLSLRKYKIPYIPLGPCLNLYQLTLNEIKVSIKEKKYKNAEELKVYKKLMIKIINIDEELEIIEVKYGWIKEIHEQSKMKERESWSKTKSADQIRNYMKSSLNDDYIKRVTVKSQNKNVTNGKCHKSSVNLQQFKNNKESFMENFSKIDDSGVCQKFLSDLQPGSMSTTNELDITNSTNSMQSTTNYSIDEKKEVDNSSSADTFIKKNERYKENKLKNIEKKDLGTVKSSNRNVNRNKKKNYAVSSDSSSDSSYLVRNDNKTYSRVETKTRKGQQNEEIDSVISRTNKNDGQFNRNPKKNYNYKEQLTNKNKSKPLPRSTQSRETRHYNKKMPKKGKIRNRNNSNSSSSDYLPCVNERVKEDSKIKKTQSAINRHETLKSSDSEMEAKSHKQNLCVPELSKKMKENETDSVNISNAKIDKASSSKEKASSSEEDRDSEEICMQKKKHQSDINRHETLKSSDGEMEAKSHKQNLCVPELFEKRKIRNRNSSNSSSSDYLPCANERVKDDCKIKKTQSTINRPVTLKSTDIEMEAKSHKPNLCVPELSKKMEENETDSDNISNEKIDKASSSSENKASSSEEIYIEKKKTGKFPMDKNDSIEKTITLIEEHEIRKSCEVNRLNTLNKEVEEITEVISKIKELNISVNDENKVSGSFCKNQVDLLHNSIEDDILNASIKEENDKTTKINVNNFETKEPNNSRRPETKLDNENQQKLQNKECNEYQDLYDDIISGNYENMKENKCNEQLDDSDSDSRYSEIFNSDSDNETEIKNVSNFEPSTSISVIKTANYSKKLKKVNKKNASDDSDSSVDYITKNNKFLSK